METDDEDDYLQFKVKAPKGQVYGFDETNFGRVNSNGYVLTHNPKYANPSYVLPMIDRKNAKLSKDDRENGRSWRAVYHQDFDKDGKADVAIFEPKGQMKYFNGYSFQPNQHYLDMIEYYNNPNYKDDKWAYAKYQDIGKRDYELALKAKAKEIRKLLKTDKELYKKVSSTFIQDLMYHYIILPVLINTGKIKGLTVQDYANMLATQMNSGEKLVKNRELMALYRLGRKAIEDEYITDGALIEGLNAVEDAQIAGIIAENKANLKSIPVGLRLMGYSLQQQ